MAIVLLILINVIQSNEALKRRLPKRLQSWDFLPLFFRSLKPYDDQFQKLQCCKKLALKQINESSTIQEKEDQKMNELEMGTTRF